MVSTWSATTSGSDGNTWTKALARGVLWDDHLGSTTRENYLVDKKKVGDYEMIILAQCTNGLLRTGHDFSTSRDLS